MLIEFFTSEVKHEILDCTLVESALPSYLDNEQITRIPRGSLPRLLLPDVNLVRLLPDVSILGRIGFSLK